MGHILLLSFFSVVGYASTFFADPEIKPHHLIGKGAFTGYQAEVVSVEGTTTKTSKYVVNVFRVYDSAGGSTARGKVRVYFPKDSSFSVGDQLYIQGVPDRYTKPWHPVLFDAKKFNRIHGITHFHFASSFVKIDSRKAGFADQLVHGLRSRANRIITEAISREKERGVLKALLIGDKTQLENSLKDAYSRAGAMHILAVSGLHVGILYVILISALKYLPLLKRKAWIVQVIALPVLWLFAAVTGFAPSVVRSVIMFTIYGVGEGSGRKSSIYNTLSVAAFFMVFFNPLILFDVGFQLSFTAVLGIVYFQPKISNWLSVKSKALKWLWSLTSVGISAQLGTLPLTLFYFKQFPTYFMLSNLIAIPLAFAAVSIGLFVLIFHSTHYIAWLESILEYIIRFGNLGIELISSLPYAVLKNRPLELLEVLLLYGIIIGTAAFFKAREFKWLVWVCVTITVLIVLDARFTIDRNRLRVVEYPTQNKEVDVFHNNRRLELGESSILEPEYLIDPIRELYSDERVD